MVRVRGESTPDPRQDPLGIVLGYHERTKHHFTRLARSLGYLDWSTQPNPFRSFSNATVYPLPRPADDDTPRYDDVYGPPRIAQPLHLDAVSRFLFDSLAISAWKEFHGNRWALRVNPSSGNLHPTEGYLLLPPIPGLGDRPGVYHYRSKDHVLEQRAEIPPQRWTELTAPFPAGAWFAGISSIPWRESWKYGERAYRYCQHDAGHALAALRLSAAALGWRLVLLESADDQAGARLLGLDRATDFPAAEPEEFEFLAAIAPAGLDPFRSLPTEAIDSFASLPWRGKANELSPDHQEWPWIDLASRACRRAPAEAPPGPVPTGRSAADLPRTAPADDSGRPPTTGDPEAFPGPRAATFGHIVRTRRSALSLDGRTGLSRPDFYRMLLRVLPGSGRPPWDALAWPPAVHLGLFVHRVEDLAPGLYALARMPAAVELLHASLDPAFEWTRPDGCPADLSLFRLRAADVRAFAARLSCDQDIAGDGAFSLGMLAEFEPALRRHGPHFYKRLFWECGAVGQVLYLEAEAANLRATGIGCFFDDPVHEAFGIRGNALQSLYHFTLGGPLEDTRLTTRPAYDDPMPRS